MAPPGVTPIQQPTMQPRTDVDPIAAAASPRSAARPPGMLACLPWNASPPPSTSRISPMPNRPMTATRKSNPRISSLEAEGHAQRARHLVQADAASAKPRHHRGEDLEGRALPMPTKLRRSEVDREEFGRPELQGEAGDQRRHEGDQDHATRAPTKEAVKAAVSASSARPCWAMGWPSKVVATDHGSPGMLNRIEVMAPPNSAPQ